ncbi:MAG: GNAT family N-acyltransferase [Celeribacter marinus]
MFAAIFPAVSTRKGRFNVRFAATSADVEAAQRLRHLAFVTAREQSGSDSGLDCDDFDALYRHVLIEDAKTGQLVCTYRFQDFQGGGDLSRSYCAQFYDLDALARYEGRMMEVGRFCIHPDWHDGDVLRTAWAVMTAYVDASGIDLLFGCSSFEGTDWMVHGDALAMLKHRHIGPKHWLPQIKAPNVFKFAARLRRKPDAKRAARAMPPLLKTYLMMGGWVSDHAVVDRQLGTMHVFTGVEIASIPDARKKLLRAAAM